MAPALVLAAEADKKDNRPERGIALYTDYSGVAVARGETVQMDLTLENKGRTDENIDVRITSVAKGWKATLKGARYQVTGMYVPDGKTKTLALNLEPEKGIGPGKYPFQFEAKTADGKFTSTHTLTVNVQERKVGADNIQITAAYPVLRGQTDAKFEFSLEVTNKGEIERTFNLAAAGPEKWEINFKPAYEQKQISSIRVKEGQSQTVAVEVTPAQNAASGEYPVLVRISSGESKAEVKLTVNLTGTYRLDAGTPNGILSLEAYGREARHLLALREEQRLRREPQHHLLLLQAGELGDHLQAGEDRSPRTRRDEADRGDDQAGRPVPRRGLLRGHHDQRGKVGQDRGDAGHGEGLFGLGLDRDRAHPPGDRGAELPVHQDGETLNVERETVIRIEELTKRYGAQTAVDRLSLEVAEGEIFGFLGPNGAGKTTTMLMLLGLTEPTSGTVRVCGYDPARDPLKVKEVIGYLPENVGFYEDMDARQNLRYIARLNRIPDAVSAARIDRLLAGGRPGQGGGQEGGLLLEGDAAAPRDRRGPDQGAEGDLPRRADDRPRSRRDEPDARSDPAVSAGSGR